MKDAIELAFSILRGGGGDSFHRYTNEELQESKAFRDAWSVLPAPNR